MSSGRPIKLRGVSVHNLRSIDLDLPPRKMIVFCGASGSGKSSLAFDTLYAEGQRRYIESFSPYTRQFLARLEKPAAERIEGIRPAIAIAQQSGSRSSRSTIGTVTETTDYLRLLFAKIGRLFCPSCGSEIRRDNPQTAATLAASLPEGTKLLVGYPLAVTPETDAEELTATLKEDGFVRVLADERTINLSEAALPNPLPASPMYVIVDRLTTGGTNQDRLADSVEIAFAKGEGRAVLFVSARDEGRETRNEPEKSDVGVNSQGAPSSDSSLAPRLSPLFTIDGQPWRRLAWNSRWRCEPCDRDFPDPEPRLFSFNSPLGACPACEGFGNTIDLDMDLVVPDPHKSLRQGAIAPWNTPAYSHELEELLALADDYGLPTEIPYADLTAQQKQLVHDGVPERKFGGLAGFFAWLERRKYKMHIRVFLSRWRSYRPCPECHGLRLRPEALAWRLGTKNLAEVNALKIRDAAQFFRELTLSDWERAVGRTMLDQVESRLKYLETVGLSYLSLDRTMRTLSGGEAQRVALTTALGSSLVDTLYVLDEPSIGLHPRDTSRLIDSMHQLRDRGNTVVVVEHDEAVIRSADQIVEIGPGAGSAGGKIVYQGSPADIEACLQSPTGDFLSGRRAIRVPERRRSPNHGWIRLSGARGNNLKNLTVEFPLGVLCVVTGVSGAGKSTLVEDTLYPALCRRLRKETTKAEPYDDVLGDGQLGDCILVDQNPIGRSPRSNPVTYLKAFDEIRATFAETVDSRMRNYTASHFSFNAEEGRCSACEGDGSQKIDMQFLPDVFIKCPQCNGTRYRDEILDVTYRGRNIAEVLQMTVREAFTFFRGRPKVQARLKRLIDVGLEYVALGQPANTLSGGEAQRLKLAGYMSAAKRERCLFLLDEPTTGLHFTDIVQLLDCFDALLAVGHSLIVVEHNLSIIQCADWLIDLGPGAAEEGGQIVAQGPPEQVAECPESVTGQFLGPALAESRKERTA